MTVSPPPLRFRVATPDDAPIIQPLVQSAYRGDESRQGWTTEADILVGNRIDVAGVVEKITNPNGVVLLATTASQDDLEKEIPIACCELTRIASSKARDSPPKAYFGMFAVSPRSQGRGIGRQVLAQAESHARDVWGASHLEMTVVCGRDELVAWYERRGFRRTGETRPFPVEEIEAMGGKIIKEGGLWFEVLSKDLGGVAGNRVTKGAAALGREENATPLNQLGVDAAAGLAR
ncbi:hypothetical protein VTJ83DRAFT_7048 [Remersonia thermophila]|uniref:N-acetyltransferase domain-containing protein n=1 Tax=Remersonia thermophila TaxID=72144 RepID=A0ABR4D2I2_9PEZI